MTHRWKIVSSAAPGVRSWGDEFVVHHALSNDTYRLAAPAGQLLCELMLAETDDNAAAAGVCLADDAETAECLAALADLGLVTEC